MTLFLLRHGIAETAGPGHPDEARALTPQGAAQMRRQAAFLRTAGLPVERLFASPYVRARQTAAIIGATLGVAVELEPALQCGCTFDEAAGLVAQAQEAAAVMLVGHQPDLGRIAQVLSGASVVVRPGTLVVLDVQRMRPHGATLAGLYDPDVMARLGGAAGI